jgi:L-2-hydroxyglutarate oxidase LhgO
MAQRGLGVLLTLDLAGQARFGPDVEWVKTIDYDVDPRRAQSFYAAARYDFARHNRCSVFFS